MNLDYYTSDDIFSAGQQYPKAKLRHVTRTLDGCCVDYIIIFSGEFDESLAIKAVTEKEGDYDSNPFM